MNEKVWRRTQQILGILFKFEATITLRPRFNFCWRRVYYCDQQYLAATDKKTSSSMAMAQNRWNMQKYLPQAIQTSRALTLQLGPSPGSCWKKTLSLVKLNSLPMGNNGAWSALLRSKSSNKGDVTIDDHHCMSALSEGEAHPPKNQCNNGY